MYFDPQGHDEDPQGHDEFIFKFSSAPNLFPFFYFLVLETLAKGRLVDPATDSKYLMFEAPPAMPPLECLGLRAFCILLELKSPLGFDGPVC